MKIRLLITVFCFALIQFQGRAAIMAGNVVGPSGGEVGTLVTLDFSYTIVTPSPEYILFFPSTPSMGGGFSSIGSPSVLINSVLTPCTLIDEGGAGIFIKLQDRSLATAGANITIHSSVLLSSYAGLCSFGSIQTATYDGTIIDYTSGSVDGEIIIYPSKVAFLTTTAIRSNSVTINWLTSQSADSYHLDVSTSPSFNTFVTGYSNLNVGNVLTYNVRGLAPNTTYYIRLASYYQNVTNPIPTSATSISVLTNNPPALTATVSLSNLTVTYDGAIHAATATTTPSGLTVDISYNGSFIVPTNAGTYAVVATVSDLDYQGTATGSLIISKATTNPVLSNLTATYNGSTHAAIATTTPGLTVGITYNGSSTVPTNVGTYAVIATVSDANYQGTASGSLVISKATVTLSLSNLTATYNGSTHVATATTVPASLTVVTTYNGSTTVPTNVGTYAVVATINDGNYQGTNTGTLVISKATSTVSLSNLVATYNGSPQIFTATTTPSGLNITKTYNGFSSIPTNAGTYIVAAIISDPNYQGTTSGSFVISKANATVSLSNLTATYDGSTHAVTATTSPSGLTAGITYNGSSTVPTNAGTYAVIAIVADANYQGTASGSLVISKGTSNPVLSGLTATYDGSTHAATATTVPTGLTVVTMYNGSTTVPTNAGTYAVVATVNDPNYQGTTSGSLVISMATANTTVSLSNLTATYNGATHEPTVTTSPSGLVVGITYNGLSTVPTNAGTYAVVATINDANYQGSTTGSFVISKATATVNLSNLTATFDGSTHAATATTVPSGLAVVTTYNGSSTFPTNAGNYAIAATVNDVNYQGSTTGSLVISKAIVNPILGNLATIYNGSPQVFTATTTPTGLNITKTYNGFSSIPTNVGTYGVAAFVGDPNYQGNTSGSFVISKATATVSVSNLTAVFDGSAHAAIATTVPSGLAVGITYNGSSTVPTNAGNYAIVATVNDVNYQGSTTGSFVISKATATVNLSNLTATFDGSTHAATATTVPSGLTVGIMYDGSSSVPTSIGTYPVVATINDANYQGTASGSLEITSISTNVTGQLLNDVQLYPNPSKDVIWVRASVSVITKISVMNLNGVTVFEKDNCTQLEPLDISNLAKGVYVVCVDSESGRGSYRVIVY